MARLLHLTLLLSATALAQADDNCHCGRINAGTSTSDGETGVSEFPPVAGIALASSHVIVCGGAIVSERHVVSAAHCVGWRPPATVAVVVGEHNVAKENETSGVGWHSVTRIVVHPDYNQRRPTTGDIAIVELSKNIQFSQFVGPVCVTLPSVNAFSYPKDYVYLLGWGEFAATRMRNTALYKVMGTFVDLRYCGEFQQDPDKLCVELPEKHICKLDGGPILWTEREQRRQILLGVIRRDTCGAGGFHLHTKVEPYAQWIKSITKGTKCFNKH